LGSLENTYAPRPIERGILAMGLIGKRYGWGFTRNPLEDVSNSHMIRSRALFIRWIAFHSVNAAYKVLRLIISLQLVRLVGRVASRCSIMRMILL